MMLLIAVLMCIYTFLDISDTLWVSYGSHLLTFIVKAVTFKADFLLGAKIILLRQEIPKQLFSTLALLINWSALY